MASRSCSTSCSNGVLPRAYSNRDGACVPSSVLLRTRTLLLLLLVVVLGLVVGRSVWAYRVYTATVDSYSVLVERHSRTDHAVQHAATIASDLESGVRGWLLTHDATFLEPY